MLSDYHAGLFAGAALYIYAVEHPAAINAGVGSFYKFFPHMYKRCVPSNRPAAVPHWYPSVKQLPKAVVLLLRRAAPIQASLALVGSTAAAIAASKGGHSSKFLWGGASVLLGAVWPFSILAMFPTINQIKLQVKEDGRSLGCLISTDQIRPTCGPMQQPSTLCTLCSAGCHALSRLELEHMC